MRQRYVQIDGQLVPADKATADLVAPMIMPDIEPFKANTGAFIEGRRQWREHLKERNCDELGHSDIKARGEQWEKRKAANAEKQKLAARLAPEVEVREEQFRQQQRSRLHAEVLNRLDGRPVPPRKDVLRLTLELAKRGSYGRR